MESDALMWRRVWIAGGVGVVVVAAGLTATLWLTSEPAARTLRGSIDITNCASLGYDNVGPDTEIIVSDDSGEIIATGELGPAPEGHVGEGCEYPFTVEDVPGGSDYYTLGVGDLDPVTVDEDELANVSMSDGRGGFP